MRLAISQLPREPTFRSLGYATLTRDYAILPMLGRSYWPMLAMLSLPYTGYAHAILCWCFILAYSDSNMAYTDREGVIGRRGRRQVPASLLLLPSPQRSPWGADFFFVLCQHPSVSLVQCVSDFRRGRESRYQERRTGVHVGVRQKCAS